MAASQTFVSLGPHTDPAVAVVHAGWQVLSPGQHAGAAAPQSVFVRHAPHEPWMQNGEPAPQSLSATHCTQPRATSHFLLPQAAAVLEAQAAPPAIPPVPLESLPPQAATTRKMKPTASADRAMRSPPLRGT